MIKILLRIAHLKALGFAKNDIFLNYFQMR